VLKRRSMSCGLSAKPNRSLASARPLVLSDTKS
jgi:hypothetical protein